MTETHLFYILVYYQFEHNETVGKDKVGEDTYTGMSNIQVTRSMVWPLTFSLTWTLSSHVMLVMFLRVIRLFLKIVSVFVFLIKLFDSLENIYQLFQTIKLDQWLEYRHRNVEIITKSVIYQQIKLNFKHSASKS